jgi:hypothetical protein
MIDSRSRKKSVFKRVIFEIAGQEKHKIEIEFIAKPGRVLYV